MPSALANILTTMVAEKSDAFKKRAQNVFTLSFYQSQFQLMLTAVNSIFLACLYENYDLERKRELLIRVSLTEATTDLERFYLKLSGDYSKAFHSAVKICDDHE